MMEKCKFLNADSYAFLIWFFLGAALTIIAWLIFFVVPIPKENIEITVDTDNSITFYHPASD